jgi:hypothetical protein
VVETDKGVPSLVIVDPKWMQILLLVKACSVSHKTSHFKSINPQLGDETSPIFNGRESPHVHKLEGIRKLF